MESTGNSYAMFVVFGKAECKYCKQATKWLFQKSKVPFYYIPVDHFPQEKQDLIKELNDHPTYPIIWVRAIPYSFGRFSTGNGDFKIGGFDDLKKWWNKNKKFADKEFKNIPVQPFVPKPPDADSEDKWAEAKLKEGENED